MISEDKLLPCPFCGGEARIHGESMVCCANNNCEGQIDFGHWCGTENGVPAINWVIKAWNTRASPWIPVETPPEKIGFNWCQLRSGEHWLLCYNPNTKRWTDEEGDVQAVVRYMPLPIHPPEEPKE